MAPTFKAGKSGYLKFAKSGSTMVFTSGVDASDFQRQVDTYDVTTYGDNDKNFIPGLRGATFKTGGPYASTYETFIATALGSTAVYTMTFGPMSTVATNVKYTAQVFLTGISVSSPAAGRVSYSLDTMISGAVTSTKF